MDIVHQCAANSFISPPVSVPVLMLPAPPKRLALPAPKIAGYLPAPTTLTVIAKTPVRRVVVAEIMNPLDLIDIRHDPKAWWAEFERIHGPDKSIEEMDAEIEAKHPGYMAWVARRKAQAEAQAEAQAATVVARTPVRGAVVAEIMNPLDLIDIRRDPKAWWAEFERIYGPDKSIEEMDAEIEAKHPGYLAWLARQKQAEAARS